MNCKLGEFALVLKGPKAGNEVQCLSLLDPPPWEFLAARAACGPLWNIDKPLPWMRESDGTTHNLAVWPDAWLMPMRPFNDEQDATPAEVDREVMV